MADGWSVLIFQSIIILKADWTKVFKLHYIIMQHWTFWEFSFSNYSILHYSWLKTFAEATWSKMDRPSYKFTNRGILGEDTLFPPQNINVRVFTELAPNNKSQFSGGRKFTTRGVFELDKVFLTWIAWRVLGNGASYWLFINEGWFWNFPVIRVSLCFDTFS